MRNLGPVDETADVPTKTYVDTADAAKIASSLVDAKGDLLAGTADNTVGRLAVGANNYVLTADSAQATGMKWAASSAGVTDHGLLTGLADDDHPQYHNDARGDARYKAAIPFGYMTFASRSAALGWAKVLTPNSQFLAGGMTITASAFVVPETARYLLTYTMTFSIAGTSCGSGVGINGTLTSEGICYQEGFNNRAFTFTGAALLSGTTGTAFSLHSYQTGGGTITDMTFYIAKIGV